MLIDFSPDGRIEFTRSPHLLALFPDDAKRIERMTDIQHDLVEQLYYIKFLRGPFADLILSWYGSGLLRAEKLGNLWRLIASEHSSGLVRDTAVGRANHPRKFVYFRTYEDAVKVEIAFVDFLREQGYSMA
jgi:hypothetical protein